MRRIWRSRSLVCWRGSLAGWQAHSLARTTTQAKPANRRLILFTCSVSIQRSTIASQTGRTIPTALGWYADLFTGESKAIGQ